MVLLIRITKKGVITLVQVSIHSNNVEQALRMLKKKMQREGLYREMKLSRHFETPSAKRKRKSEENERRRRKLDRKKLQES